MSQLVDDHEAFMHEALDAARATRNHLLAVRAALFPPHGAPAGPLPDVEAAFAALTEADAALCKILPGAEPMWRRRSQGH